MKAWHFCKNNKRLGYNDGRLIKTGRNYKVFGQPILCLYGLHGSIKIMDALTYAMGNILCRINLHGKILKGSDKAVATERTVLWMFDCTKILHEFACKCAERALHKAKIIDKSCWSAISAKRLWLQGKITNKDLDTVRLTCSAVCFSSWSANSAAVLAAYGAAKNAACSSAWDASCSSACCAARFFANSAAKSSWDAAWDVAWSAEQKWQEKTLLKMIKNYRGVNIC